MIQIVKIQQYIRQTSGAIAILFALSAPLVIGSVGMALDMAQAYLVQQRLSQALDAAALAAAAMSGDADTITQKVQEFFDANYPPEKLGVTFTPEVVVDGDEVYVTGYAQYNTMFLQVIGIDQIELAASAVVQRDVQGIEVALVLDNTGSMATNNNITSLKRAATSFINIMFSSASQPEYVRIGLVPYSNSVRVGRYGLGLNPDGSDYEGDAFVTLPSGISYTTNHDSSSGWYGCVVEHEADNYNAAATHVSNSRGQLWSTGTGASSTKCSSSATCRGHGWAPNSTTNDPYPDDIFPDLAGGDVEYEGPWDIYMYGKLVGNNTACSGSGYSSSRCSDCTGTSSRCASTYCYCGYSVPNEGCPYATIQPITSDQDLLLSQVDPDDYNVMYPHGNTLGNIGMLWGGRVLSPEPPFEEGMPWDSEYWKKAVVMMTDGDNTENGTYSSFWMTAKNNMTVTKFNQRFEETCDNLKAMGVIIYTVTFTSGINADTKGYYERCATSPDQYFDAPTQDDLEDAFEQIARELSNLHLKQ